MDLNHIETAIGLDRHGQDQAAVDTTACSIRIVKIADTLHFQPPVLDILGEALVKSGEKQQALEVINQIVLMNPPNVNEYRQLLTQMQNS